MVWLLLKFMCFLLRNGGSMCYCAGPRFNIPFPSGPFCTFSPPPKKWKLRVLWGFIRSKEKSYSLCCVLITTHPAWLVLRSRASRCWLATGAVASISVNKLHRSRVNPVACSVEVEINCKLAACCFNRWSYILIPIENKWRWFYTKLQTLISDRRDEEYLPCVLLNCVGWPNPIITHSS
jgi:hypothetical protein